MIQTINNAMSKRREALENGEKEKGFTLIELMVVIIIIGILAAIAIPAFLNQRQAAWDSSVKSDLSSGQIAAESFATANNGSYLTLTQDGLVKNGLKVTDGNTIKLETATKDGYTISGVNKNSGTTFTYTSSTGKITP